MDHYKRVRSRSCLRPFYVVHQYISCTIHHNDAVCNDAIGIIIRRCPGPIRYPCAICDRPVARNHYVLQCDFCDQWVHIQCDGISMEEYQRLPGACNRSPGSKLLSITTQLHCGDHLGGRVRLPDTILEEDHPMTIQSKLGSN